MGSIGLQTAGLLELGCAGDYWHPFSRRLALI
jgi:hypothetical protein